MKSKGLLVATTFLLCAASLATGEEMAIVDDDTHLLMRISDEGTAGAVGMPPSAAVPADSTDKLYNLNGALRWRDAQLGIGWTRTGTAMHLTTATDNVGIGVADPDAKLEVAGQVKITGGAPGADKLLTADDEGLAAWETVHRPRATYVGGNLLFQLAATPRMVKQIAINVPAAGSVRVSATGYVSWGGRQKDSARFCISASSTADMDPDYLMELTDYGCTDCTDQYASWKTQRAFSVPSAGTYTYYLWGDAPLTDNVNPCVDPTDGGNCNSCFDAGDLSQTRVDDVNMFAKYRP